MSTLCLEMPIHQSASQDARATKHISELEKKFENVHAIRTDLTAVFDQFVDTLPNVENDSDRFLTLANSRSRLRMLTLYYFAALYGYLVVGTGNKIEDFGVGFYTKYGDGGVDLSPIADLVKSEVYQLGGALEVIRDIMVAKPTDGLWGDDRTDEDQLGATYPELEWAMDYIDSGQSSALSPRQSEALRIYQRLHHANRHKMEPVPVCVVPASVKQA